MLLRAHPLQSGAGGGRPPRCFKYEWIIRPRAGKEAVGIKHPVSNTRSLAELGKEQEGLGSQSVSGPPSLRPLSDFKPLPWLRRSLVAVESPLAAAPRADFITSPPQFADPACSLLLVSL